MEREIKLSNTNTQVKFFSINSKKEIIKKLLYLCDLLAIKCLNQHSIINEDVYYDTNDGRLIKNRSSLRRRRETNGEMETIEYTVKKFIRMEGGRMDREEFTLKIANPKDDKEILYKAKNEYFADLLDSKSDLKEVISISTSRLIFELEHNSNVCELCFDEYEFFHDGQTSDKYHQIELEFKDELSITDINLNKLISGLGTIFEFYPEKESKYEQSILWSKSKAPKTVDVTSLMIDIVGYSLQSNVTQRTFIVKLNSIVTSVMSDVYDDQNLNFNSFYIEKADNKSQSIDYIPTGDGMIIVIKDKPNKLPLICKKILKKVREYSINKEEDSKFQIRMGINYGPVFIYSDIRGNANFAGNGINMVQRVCNLGNESQILFSKEAYENCENKDSNFKDFGKYEIKHEKSLHVYNYYSSEEGYGNPIKPVR